MKKEKKYDKEYMNLLEKFELPLVYRFAKENKPNGNGVLIHTMPTEFYQSEDSVLYEPTKPISKIFL
jgi:hypothetical protein